MTVTLNGLRPSALAADSPPKPAPTMTTRLFMKSLLPSHRQNSYGDQVVRVHRGASANEDEEGSANEPGCIRPGGDRGDSLADRERAHGCRPAARRRGHLRAPDGRSGSDRRGC